jgi:hypothetical protein
MLGVQLRRRCDQHGVRRELEQVAEASSAVGGGRDHPNARASIGVGVRDPDELGVGQPTDRRREPAAPTTRAEQDDPCLPPACYGSTAHAVLSSVPLEAVTPWPAAWPL